MDRGVPEVFGSSFDARVLLKATYYLAGRKKLAEMKLPFFARLIEAAALHKTKGTYLAELLEDAQLA